MFPIFLLRSVSIYITSALNSASDRFLVSILFSPFAGILLLFHVGYVSLSPRFGCLPVFVSTTGDFNVFGRAAMSPSLGRVA